THLNRPIHRRISPPHSIPRWELIPSKCCTRTPGGQFNWLMAERQSRNCSPEAADCLPHLPRAMRGLFLGFRDLHAVQQGTSFVFMALLLVANSRAAVPTLDYLFPAGGQRGTSVTVTAGGKFESWPMKVW